MKPAIGVMLVGVLLVAGCGGSTARPEGEPLGGGERPNWEQPLPGGVAIRNAGEADLAFSPVVPRLGLDPVRVVATAPEHAPKAFREIAWVFDHPTIGRFVVFEGIVDESATRAEYEELASASPGCVERPGGELECHVGNRSLLSLKDGTRAFLLEGDVTTTIHWFEPLAGVDTGALEAFPAEFADPVLEIRVMGPAPEFTGTEAIAIAESL